MWDMTLKKVLGMTGWMGGVALVFMFAMWFQLSVGILCVMEGLSAFLHALRLHWYVYRMIFLSWRLTVLQGRGQWKALYGRRVSFRATHFRL
jgi:hypothetical protein